MLNFCVGCGTRVKEFFLSDLKKVTTGDLMKINQRSAGDLPQILNYSDIYRALWHISFAVAYFAQFGIYLAR